MRKLFTLYKIELKLTIRELSGVLFGVLIPVGLMFLLGALYGNKTISTSSSITLVQQAVPGVITIGLCASGLMGLPLALANYREKRILRRFQVTPTKPITLLLVQFLVQASLAITSSLLVWLVAKLFFHYTMIGQPFLFLLIYLLLLISIFSIGLLIASIANNTNTASLLAIILYFPMFLLSGATIPFEILPKALQNISKIFPLTQGIIALKEVSLSSSPDLALLPILLLGLLPVCFFFLSSKLFKYEY